MKSYSMIGFFLSLAMILCPLISVEKATSTIAQDLFGDNPTGLAQKSSESEAATVKIMSADSKNITEISLKEYLIGVIFAEIGPLYNEEAIKAQVIASHTVLEYTKSNANNGLNGADISNSSQTHQGYLTREEQQEKWGENYDVYRQKVEKCVDEVLPLIIYYNNSPIAAAFFAVSNGKTENSSDVWGGSLPYLISVNSDCDKSSPSFLSTETVDTESFIETITENGGTDRENIIGEITRTETGMVKTVTLCGKVFKGTEIRKLFSLNSSTFTVEEKDSDIIFTVSGRGHGVGMSQYGANYMASQGLTYKEILGHYYPNTEIK